MSRRIGKYFYTWIFHSGNNQKISISVVSFSRYNSTGGTLHPGMTNNKLDILKYEGWKWQSLCTATTEGDNKNIKMDNSSSSSQQQLQLSHSEMITKRTLKKLQEILLIDPSKAVRLVKKYPMFKSTSMQKISDTIKFLGSRNVGISRIRNNPWLLLMSPDDIDKKSKVVMSYLKVDFPVAVAFCKKSRNVLVKIAAVWKSKYEVMPRVDKGPYAPQPKNRLEYLACRLECSVEEVADMMVKVPNIATAPIDKLDRVMKLLLEAEVSPDAIVCDPWTFDNQMSRMEDRLNICREQGCKVIKPWILRAPIWKFESYIARGTETESSPADSIDVDDFLRTKLGCSPSVVKAMLKKVPSIKNRNATELNKVINFLFSKGFTSSHIVETPRVLDFNVSTITKRLEDLSTFDCVPDSLQVLCQTAKRYDNLIKRMIKDSRNKSTSCEV